MAEAFDPTALLSKPLSEVHAPVPIAVGSWVFTITKHEFDKTKPADGKEGTPLVRFELTPSEPLPDVDATELQAFLDGLKENGQTLSDNKQRLEFYLTPNALYRLKEFGVDHCKVNESEVSNTGELIQACGGRQVVGTVTLQPNKKEPARPYRNVTSTAPIPE